MEERSGGTKIKKKKKREKQKNADNKTSFISELVGKQFYVGEFDPDYDTSITPCLH